MTWLDAAYAEILDTLTLIQRAARHCPLGLADPDVPAQGWAYSLPGDPGHPWTPRVLGQQWSCPGLVLLWFRDASHRVTAWALECWRVSAADRPPVWHWRWMTWVMTDPAGRTRWQPDAWEPLSLLWTVPPCPVSIRDDR